MTRPESEKPQDRPCRLIDQRGRIALFGGPGGAAIVADYASGADGEVIGLLNDVVEKGERINGHLVLGPFSTWHDLPDDIGFLAPLHKVKDMQARARLIDGLGVPDERWAVLIDPRAAVSADVTFGPGCHVGPFAEVHPGARIGRHVGVRGGARISHECAVGDYAFIGLNSVVCGYVEIGRGAHVAPQSAIREGARIGRFAVIGLGAVVVSDVDDFAVVAGNPARQIGTVPVLETAR